MNSINVIAPYKFAGRMWVFDDPTMVSFKKPLLAVRTQSSTVLWPTFLTLPPASYWSSLPLLFPGTHSGWNGAGAIPKGIGTTPGLRP